MLNPALLTININANEMCLDINLNIKTRNITVIRKVINIYTNIYKRINVFLIIIIIYFNTRKNTKRIWYVHIRLATIYSNLILSRFLSRENDDTRLFSTLPILPHLAFSVYRMTAKRLFAAAQSGDD